MFDYVSTYICITVKKKTYEYLMPKASSRQHGVVSNLSLNLDYKRSDPCQHIKKIRNEKLKWI